MENPQKILLVDDNPDLLLVIQIILKGQGFYPITALSINEASKKINIHKPPVILMDLQIGDSDGASFCTQLKNQQSTQGIRVIMMSGIENVKEKAEQFGADDYLPKPFQYDDLMDHVTHQYDLALKQAV